MAMKRLLFLIFAGLSLLLFAADRSIKDNAGIGESNNAADPVAPFDGYTAGMAVQPGDPNAVEWQAANRKQIDVATDKNALAAFVKDATSADQLLARVKGAYATDPLVATTVAAVTQYVMSEEPAWYCFWMPSPAEGRKVWVAALERRVRLTDDAYVRIFCFDQLRWCQFETK